MVGNVEDEKLDPSRCEDEGVAKERMKRRADEGQEEDVDGNWSRAKTPRREIVNAAVDLEVASFATLPEVGRSKDKELVACDDGFTRDAPRISRPPHLNSSESEVETPVLESPPEPASQFSCLLGACKSAYFATSFEFIGLMAFPSE